MNKESQEYVGRWSIAPIVDDSYGNEQFILLPSGSGVLIETDFDMIQIFDLEWKITGESLTVKRTDRRTPLISGATSISSETRKGLGGKKLTLDILTCDTLRKRYYRLPRQACSDETLEAELFSVIEGYRKKVNYSETPLKTLQPSDIVGHWNPSPFEKTGRWGQYIFLSDGTGVSFEAKEWTTCYTDIEWTFNYGFLTISLAGTNIFHEGGVIRHIRGVEIRNKKKELHTFDFMQWLEPNYPHDYLKYFKIPSGNTEKETDLNLRMKIKEIHAASGEVRGIDLENFEV